MNRNERAALILSALFFSVLVLALTLIGQYEKEEREAKEAWENNAYSDICILAKMDGELQKIELYHADSVLYAFLPAGADTDNLELLYDTQKYSVVWNGSSVSGTESITALSADKTYTIEIQNLYIGRQEQYVLQIMQSANIPAIFIDTKSESMDHVNQEKGNAESGNITYISTDGEILYAGKLDKITGRGNSSWEEDKKSYSITLEENVNFENMGSARKWVLQANALDATRMRNKITYDMAKQSGLPNAIDSAYVDVYFNGQYAGNYLLCEKIEVGENRVNISESDYEEVRKDIAKEEQYIATQEGAYWQYDSQRNPEKRGYLLEFNDRIEDEQVGYLTANDRQVEIKSPKYTSVDEYEYISSYVVMMTDSLINAAESNEYEQYIDADSWCRVFLINELTNDTDANRYSVFYYKDYNTKMYAGPVWDYDIAWGNDIVGKDPRCSFFRTGWYGSLYENEDFYQKIVSEYRETFRPLLESYLENGIDETREWIRESVKMDDIRWSDTDSYTRRSPYRDFDEAVEYFKSYMEERTACYDEVWLSGETYHTVFFVDGDLIVARTYVQDGERIPESMLDYVAQCLAQSSFRTETGETFLPDVQVWDDIKLYAQ